MALRGCLLSTLVLASSLSMTHGAGPTEETRIDVLIFSSVVPADRCPAPYDIQILRRPDGRNKILDFRFWILDLWICGSIGEATCNLQSTIYNLQSKMDRAKIVANCEYPAIKDTYDDGTNALHAKQPPNGALRGYKGSLYEGGHRVPFLARWPGRIKTGATSDRLFGLVDMMASFASVAGCPLSADAGPDSIDASPAILGDASAPPPRDHLVLQAYGGTRPLALRQGPWKLIEKGKKAKSDPDTAAELYRLDEDLAETRDLASDHPERVRDMIAALDQIRGCDRTR